MPDILLITVFSNPSYTFALDLEELMNTLTSKVSNVLMVKVSCQNIIFFNQINKFKSIFPLLILIELINTTSHNNQLARTSKYLLFGRKFKVIHKRTFGL